MKLKPGIKLLADTAGGGAPVQRRRVYQVQLRMWLNQGEPVRWARPWGQLDDASLADDGHTLITDLRVDRESMFDGLFYGVQSMRVGGTRKLQISPHLAFGANGVAGTIPADAALLLEVTVIAERPADRRQSP